MVMQSSSRRRGAMVPLVAIALIGLLGFVALAIDIGIIAVARNRCQNAADVAALAGARTLNGDVANNNNYSNVGSNAKDAANVNTMLGQAIDKNNVTVKIGSYSYDYSLGKFIHYPDTKPTGENWTAVECSVSSGTQNNFFAQLLASPTYSTTATAVAAHRARDVILIADLSSSMRLDSQLGAPHYGKRVQAMCTDPVYPKFGHYNGNSSWVYNTNVYVLSNGEVGGNSNLTIDSNAGTALIKDFYKDTTRYGTSELAFSPAADSYADTPDGDNYLPKYGMSVPNYGKHVTEITGSTAVNATWESNGYGANFKGYTLGPRYWGKTFFIWPPDPRSDKDWRQKFFTNPSTGLGVTRNTRLWDSSNGLWNAPSSTTYSINYNAILNWLRNTGPNPFPDRLQAGGILYYDAIPTTITIPVNGSAPTNQNERFWKEFIDYVIGVRDNYDGTYSSILDSSYGYTVSSEQGCGPDQNWGGWKVSTKPSDRYMAYDDNPLRPVARLWFGPMSMVDFLGNDNQKRTWWPGTCHEAPTYQLKLGLNAALKSIELNHPNDSVGLIYFSNPQDDLGNRGFHNTARVGLGRDYESLTKSLWFAPQSIDDSARDIRPYDTDKAIDMVPRSTGGTCYPMALYLAYNQLSTNRSSDLYTWNSSRPGEAGGNGRIGAQKLIIFETDGLVNRTADANFVDAGKNISYYQVRIGASNEYPSNVGNNSSATQQSYDIATRICAMDTDPLRGYATKRKPVLIHCIAFGSLFDSTNTSQGKSDALTRLEMLQYIGGKAGGEQSSATTALASYKVITGTPSERISNLEKAINRIMQDGVQVSLIK